VEPKITEELFTRYLAGDTTPAEEQLIAEWYASFDHLSPYFDNENSTEAIDLKAKIKTAIKTTIAGETKQASEPSLTKRTGRKSILAHSRIAAAIIILLTAGLFWMFLKNNATNQKAIVKNAPPVNDSPSIIPGANKAVLTLADGTTVVLDNAANGTLAQQNNVQVVKSKDGELEYQPAIVNRQSANGPSRREQSAMVTYNKLSTPRGGQYMIVLPDGSKVWLNAASSIKYPTAFTGNERRVEVTGEVYFEVASLTHKDGSHKIPFVVDISPTTQAGGSHIEVLGTHFNVNAYNDEGTIKTTLLEGKVKFVNRQSALNAAEGSVILKPGEQAIATSFSPRHDGHTLTIDHSPDIESVMAWKNGLFQFNNVTIETVMRQVARWYDVQVVYERDASKDLFRGKIYRNTEMSQLLKILELSGAHFKIEGKKVIVQ
jgi:ferric-dicitrate binding protein FerR (iron transport regulator)